MEILFIIIIIIFIIVVVVGVHLVKIMQPYTILALKKREKRVIERETYNRENVMRYEARTLYHNDNTQKLKKIKK